MTVVAGPWGHTCQDWGAGRARKTERLPADEHTQSKATEHPTPTPGGWLFPQSSPWPGPRNWAGLYPAEHTVEWPLARAAQVERPVWARWTAVCRTPWSMRGKGQVCPRARDLWETECSPPRPTFQSLGLDGPVGPHNPNSISLVV